MLRVSEFSLTAVSPHTASRSSSFVISFRGLRNRNRSTRNAFGSTGTTSPALTRQNSRSRTSTSAKRNTEVLDASMIHPLHSRTHANLLLPCRGQALQVFDPVHYQNHLGYRRGLCFI